MHRRGWNKVLVLSFSLGAAGILACISTLLDSLVPTRSFFAAIVSMVALAVAILVTVAGYVWICDKCQDIVSRYFEWVQSKRSHRAGADVSEGSLAQDGADRQSTMEQVPISNLDVDRHFRTLLDLLRRKPASSKRSGAASWRGQ